MKWIRPKIVLVLTAILVIGGPCATWYLAWRSEARKAHSDFQWFSTLGFPDVKGQPFVRVATGWWIESGHSLPNNRYVSGFLLSSNAHDFQVLTLQLSRQFFTNSAAGTPEHKRVGFETLDLRREAHRQVQELRTPAGKEDYWQRFGEKLPQEGEVFVLAWACWREGLEAEAADLYGEAGKLPRQRVPPKVSKSVRARLGAAVQWVKGLFQKPAKPSLRERIEKEVAHRLMWQAVLDFGDPSISRPELLSQLETIVQKYPHTEHRERARKTAEVLKRMIAEDQAHTRTGAKDLTQLSDEEKVRELIFRLRDQNGHQWSQPGGCDIFDDLRGKTNTPAHQLVALGYAAVPQLIAALDSDTLTRSVGYHRDFYFSHTVLTVGDCAATILTRITGKSFFTVGSTYSYMSKDGAVSATRRAAEAWWEEFQKKGERQMLVEALAQAGYDAPAEAEILRQKYPEIATAALISGAAAATNSWVRTQLVEDLGKIGDGPAMEFLYDELLKGPMIETRVAAAYGVLRSNRSLAITSMRKEWEQLGKPGAGKEDEDEDSEGVVYFLATRDSVEAVSALATNLRQRPVGTRFKVIEALGEPNDWAFDHKNEQPSQATLEAVESCLVAQLEDTERRTGMSGSRNGKNYSDPRLCDMAAWLLAERWPKRYSFDISGSLKARDHQRIVCLNAWRKAHNLTLIPLPEGRVVTVGRRDATKVTAIEWSPQSAQPSEAFAGMLNTFSNRLFTSKDLVALLTSFAAHPEPNAAGLELQVIKDEDLTGVRLLVRLIPGKPPARTGSWSVNESVTLGHNNLHLSGGGGTMEAYGEVQQWQSFADASKQAIAGSPETPFEIGVKIIAEKNQESTPPEL